MKLPPVDFSEAHVHELGDRLELEWTHRGELAATVVSDMALEHLVDAINTLRRNQRQPMPHEHVRDELAAVIKATGEEGWTAMVAADRCVHVLVLLGLLPETETSPTE